MFNFAQPWMLWGLLAVFLPIAIHLINRWRHKSVPWAAMAFLIRATRELRGTRKLRHYLILASRVLAVAALAFALSRPRTSAWLGIGGNQPDNILVLLDRSASMEIRPEGDAQSLRELTLERLKNTMTQMGGSRFFLMESAGGRVMEVTSPDILTGLSETGPTDTMADIPALMEQCAQYVRENLIGTSEIWVASDRQESNWMPDSGKWEQVRESLQSPSGAISVRVLTLKERSPLDRGVRVGQARIRDNELALSLIVHQGGENVPGGVLNIPVTISINGGRISESLSVSGNVTRLEKAIPLPSNMTTGYGFVSLPHDSNPRNDVSYFTFSPDKDVKVVAVGEPGDSLNVLRTMAAPPGIPGRIGQSMTPGQWEKADVSSCSLLIWEGPLPESNDAAKVRDFVEKGGIALFLPGKSGEGNAEFMGIKWGSREEAPEDKLFLLPYWENEMGPLRDGADGRPIPVDHVRAILRRNIIGEGMPMAAWDDESPALLRKIVGQGQILFLGTEPLYEWSNLADGYMLLPLLQRLAEEGGSRFVMPNSHDLGTWDLPVRESQSPMRMDGYEKEAPQQKEHIAGVFQLDSEYYALNRPEAEDEMEELPADSLQELFGKTKLTSFEDGSRDKDSLVKETWRFFYIFLILMLAAEAILCLPRILPVNRKTP